MKRPASLGLGMTNATKAIVAGLVASALSLLTAFGLSLSAEQVGAINAFVNAVLVAWVALSYKESPKRVGDRGDGSAIPGGVTKG